MDSSFLIRRRSGYRSGSSYRRVVHMNLCLSALCKLCNLSNYINAPNRRVRRLISSITIGPYRQDESTTRSSFLNRRRPSFIRMRALMNHAIRDTRTYDRRINCELLFTNMRPNDRNGNSSNGDSAHANCYPIRISIMKFAIN